MKNNILLIISLALFIYSLKISITFKPFSISFGTPYLSLGWVFIIIGFVCINYHYDSTAYKRGVDDTIECLKESLKKHD